jgi:hypothetical protein
VPDILEDERLGMYYENYNKVVFLIINKNNMDYLELALGIILTVTYIWLIRRRRENSSLLQSVFHFDIIIGMIAGLYLIITSIYSLYN